MQKRFGLLNSYSFYFLVVVVFNALAFTAHAHTHSEGALNIVQDENRLVVSLVLSASDVVGFEHSPVTKEQKLKVDRELSKFKEPNEIFILSEPAECRLLDKVHILAGELLKQKKNSDLQKNPKHKNKKHRSKGGKNQQESAEGATHAKHDHGTPHSDIEVSYMYECKKVSELKEIRLNLFKAYPLIKTLKARFISSERQILFSLNAKNYVLKFKK